MTIAKRLKSVEIITPQCAAPFPSDGSTYNMSYWADRKKRAIAKGWDVKRCMNHSFVDIDGQCLCKSHAQSKALRILMGVD